MSRAARSKEYWWSQRQSLLKMYEKDNLSIRKIGEHYGVSVDVMNRVLHSFNVKTRNTGDGSRCNALYSLDSTYFSTINTEEKAYVLGFTVSDGHVSKNNSLMFALHSKDVDVLEKIKRCLESNAPIKRKGDYMMFNVTSKTLCDNLRSFGLDNQKTFSLKIENVLRFIPSTLVRHFVRGMFDGDGSIRIYRYDYVTNPMLHLGYTGN